MSGSGLIDLPVLNGDRPLGDQISAINPTMRRVYVETDRRSPHFGHRCLSFNTGRTKRQEVLIKNSKGEDVKTLIDRPIFEARRVRDLEARGLVLPVNNATSLRKDEWLMMDQAVIRAARQRLRAWADLAGANTYGGFNGMSKMILEHETMSDPGEAHVDFDGLTEGRTDSPVFQREGLPLPITHSDFWFSSRRLEISRAGNMPIDIAQAEAAGRRVAENVEQTLIGTVTGPTMGDATLYGRTPSVYGYTNFPARLTKAGTAPTGSNPEVIIGNVLAALEQLYTNKFYGPFMVYHSTPWGQYLDNDYARLGGINANMTLRDRIRRIEGIQDVRRLDYLTSGYQMLFVQMTSDVARAVVGMDMTTVQWESMGGMRLNFKVMAIMVPQIRADFYGNCGILHMTST